MILRWILKIWRAPLWIRLPVHYGMRDSEEIFMRNISPTPTWMGVGKMDEFCLCLVPAHPNTQSHPCWTYKLPSVKSQDRTVPMARTSNRHCPLQVLNVSLPHRVLDLFLSCALDLFFFLWDSLTVGQNCEQTKQRGKLHLNQLHFITYLFPVAFYYQGKGVLCIKKKKCF